MFFASAYPNSTNLPITADAPSAEQEVSFEDSFNESFPDASPDASIEVQPETAKPPAVEKPSVEDAPPAEIPEEKPPVEDAPPAAEKSPEELEAERVKALEELDLDKIEPPRGTSPKNLVNFKQLADTAKHWKTKHDAETAQLKTEIEQLKTKTVSMPPEVETELKDLRTFRKIHDAENDPEFKKQFDEKISGLDDQIIKILTDTGLTAEMAAKVREVGIPKAIGWLNKEVLPKLDDVTRDRVTRRLSERADVDDQRSAEVAKFSEKREQYIQQQEKEQTERFQQDQQQIETHVKEIIKDVPWAKPVEIPPNASADEKKRLEAHNQGVEQLGIRFNEALYPATPKARAEIAAAAVASTVLSSQLATARTQLKATETKLAAASQELIKLKSAGRIPEPTDAKLKKDDEQDTLSMAPDDAIDAGLDAAATE